MRTFVAFPVPTEPLQSLLEKIPLADRRPPSEYHCTLKFLGEVREAAVPRLGECLRHVSFSPFTLSYDSLGAFPTKTSPEIIWVGLRPKRPVIDLHRRIDDVFDTVFPREDRFTPHVTILRVSPQRGDLYRTLSRCLVLDTSFTIDRFYLYKSERRGNRYHYTRLAEFSASS
jgi:2'-5' RNA ligase